MIIITKSVGRRGENRPEDVAIIRRRLVSLGYDWIAGSTHPGPTFVQVIRLFQSIKGGQHTVGGPLVDGRVDPNGDTLRWLNAQNAPRWKRMTASGPGFVNTEIQDRSDHHDFGCEWLDAVIRRAGLRYEAEHLATHADALIAVNDVSMPRGGDTPDHRGHETGMACDLRLPRRGGGFGRITTASEDYDQDAMRAQLRAFLASPNLERVFLNDDVLISEGLCLPLAGHDNHAHIQISPPARIAP